MKPILSLLAAFALAAPAAAWQDEFFGCFNPSDVPASAVDASGSDSETCSAACLAANYLYSYFMMDTSSCSCSNDYPSPALMQQSSGLSTPYCPAQARAARVSTTWYWLRCSSFINSYDNTNTVPPAPTPPRTIQPDPRACNARCNAEIPLGGHAAYIPATGACQCSPGMTTNDIPCTANNYIIFYNFGSGSASQFARRAERVKVERRRRQVPALCPPGRTACRVTPDADDYECLDTYAELESCGGCTLGRVIPEATRNITEPAGVDCTALRGIRPGAVTCTKGKCVASACRIGYLLAGGRCVPGLSL